MNPEAVLPIRNISLISTSRDLPHFHKQRYLAAGTDLLLRGSLSALLPRAVGLLYGGAAAFVAPAPRVPVGPPHALVEHKQIRTGHGNIIQVTYIHRGISDMVEWIGKLIQDT